MPTPRKSADRFQERAELLDFLLDVAALTSETLDLDKLLANVADIVREVIPYDLFAILLHSEKQGAMRIRYSIGHRDEVVRNLVVSLDEGITGAAATARQPVLVGDVRSDGRYLNAVDAVRTELAVPMIARGKLVGVIDIQSTRLNAYTDQDRDLVRLIASRIAVSIDNARLYRRVERQNRTLRTLAQLSQEFSSTLDLNELLQRISKAVRRLIDYDAFSILLVDEGRKVLRNRFSARYDERVHLDNIPLGKGITGAAAEMREPVRVEDTRADPRYIESTPGIRSEMAVPLMVPDRVVGVMDLESERIGHFSDDHVRLLSLVAPLVASAVDNARLYEELAERKQRMEHDLMAARKLQSLLLPRTAPHIEGLEVAIGNRPAREISGDVYDFFECGDNTAMAFGDVSGKGAGAALYGALLSGLLRTLTRTCQRPAELMRSLNDALLQRKIESQYVSLLVLLWNAPERRLTMANAGALPPLVCRGGEILKPRVEGVPLGLLEAREYDEIVFKAEPGDVVLLYSDGIPDQLNAAGEEYGRGRLIRLLTTLCDGPANSLVEAVYEDMDRFSDGARAFDDQTLLVLKVG